jgi:hypothetical protein
MAKIPGAVFPRQLDKVLPLAVSSKGVWIETSDGKRYLDASGGAVVVEMATPIDQTIPNVRSGQGLKKTSFPSADGLSAASWGGSGVSSGLTVFFSSLRCLLSSCFFFFANSFWRFSD